jgi:sterol desaturase/sphingolipid hydroxylase (fatty acid hydroxylase superfamily)
VFHRWHHSAAAESREKNYAPLFPLWDLMFGTFYMPAHARPDRFGADGVPEDLVGQLVYPLRRAPRAARPSGSAMPG